MKYTISIDQVHAREWGLSFSEAAVFSFCNELSTWADPIVIDGQVWYFASRNKVIEELPMVTDKPDTIYRIFKTLNEKGVIRWQKNGEKDCVQLTAKGKEWNSEKNPRLGKKSELPRKNFRMNSEKNPTDNNTIDNNTIDKREKAPANLDFFNPNKHEETAAHLINFLEKPENAMWLNGMANGNWQRAVKKYCLKLQKLKKWHDLTVPTDDGRHYIWAGEMIAGIKSWYQTAAEIDRSSGRGNDKPVIPARPKQEPEPEIELASVEFAKKLLGYEAA